MTVYKRLWALRGALKVTVTLREVCQSAVSSGQVNTCGNDHLMPAHLEPSLFRIFTLLFPVMPLYNVFLYLKSIYLYDHQWWSCKWSVYLFSASLTSRRFPLAQLSLFDNCNGLLIACLITFSSSSVVKLASRCWLR